MFTGSKFSHLVTGMDFSCGNVLHAQDSAVALFLGLCFLRIQVRDWLARWPAVYWF